MPQRRRHQEEERLDCQLHDEHRPSHRGDSVDPAGACRLPHLSPLPLQLPPDDVFLVPKVIAADHDLVLLRVPVGPLAQFSVDENDFFVYRVHHEDPRLERLPAYPYPHRMGDRDIAILSCGAGGKQQQRQDVVASLRQFDHTTFQLHLYREGSGTYRRLRVEEPELWDSTIHRNTKTITITLGGGGTKLVGWVDLSRGIILCDLLQETPKLRDVPLPWPARGNRRRGCEEMCRDIIVTQHQDSIKYVQMEETVPTEHWKVAKWSMPIPVASSRDEWRLECTADSCEFHVHGNPIHHHHHLLCKFIGSSGSLDLGYPALSIDDDDDVIYLLSKPESRGEMGLVIAFDVRNKELQGLAEIHNDPFILRRGYLVCGISKHLQNNTTAAVSSKQTSVDLRQKQKCEVSSKQISLDLRQKQEYEVSSKQISVDLRQKQKCEEKTHEDSTPYIMVGSIRVIIP